MYKREAEEKINQMQTAKSGTVLDACARYGYGRASMMKVAEQAKAIVRFGRTIRINYSKVDAFIDSISE